MIAAGLGPASAGLSAAATLVFPVVGPILMPLSAARLARLVRNGSEAGGFALAALTVPFAMVFGLLAGAAGPVLAPVVAVALAALPALGLSVAARDGRRLDLVSIVVASLVAVGGLAVLAGVGLATGLAPGEVVARRLDVALPELVASYRKAGLVESSLSAMESLFVALTWMVRHQLTGLVLLGAVLYGTLLTYPAGRAAGVPGWKVTATSFAQYRTPLAAVVLFVAAGLGAGLGAGRARHGAIDILLPLGALFFVRGMAIIRALLDRGGVGLLGRALAWSLVVQMPLPILVALGGLFDEFFGFRERLFTRHGPEGGKAP